MRSTLSPGRAAIAATAAGLLAAAVAGCGEDPALPEDAAPPPTEPEGTEPADDDPGQEGDDEGGGDPEGGGGEPSAPPEDIDPYADEESVLSGVLAVVDGVVPAADLATELAVHYEEATGSPAEVECAEDLPAEPDAMIACTAHPDDGESMAIAGAVTNVEGEYLAFLWHTSESQPDPDRDDLFTGTFAVADGVVAAGDIEAELAERNEQATGTAITIECPEALEALEAVEQSSMDCVGEDEGGGMHAVAVVLTAVSGDEAEYRWHTSAN